ncbi:hypothetical protein [Rhizobium leguminosarum]|uniref:hypothetical protein n=1 Tax=Rhizobium leguminosarum TaxID=384 RepID=UPI0014414A07|nr:hypothetical protein [Rhizobium leguminosarum]NKK77701.1 hypothetical protein [Rhizobium leguminosarum bv. viciae]
MQEFTNEQKDAIYTLIVEEVPNAGEPPQGLVRALIEGVQPKPVDPEGAVHLAVDYKLILDAILTFLSVVGPIISMWKDLTDLLDRKPSKAELEEKIRGSEVTAKIFHSLPKKSRDLLLSRLAS